MKKRNSVFYKAIYINLILLMALLIYACPPPEPTPTITPTPSPSPTLTPSPPPRIKGVNYYHSSHPWDLMWLEWDPEGISQQLDTVMDLHLNVIETYLHYPVFYSLSKRAVDEVMLDRLDEFLAIVDSKNCYAILTLFDYVTDVDESTWEDHKVYLDGIIGRFKNDERILMWDLQNEINRLVTENGQPLDTVLAWIEEMTGYLKSIDTLHPVELEVNDPAFTVHLAGLDFDGLGLSFHGEPWELSAALETARSATDKPVMISEFGKPADPASDSAVIEQKIYYDRILDQCKEEELDFRLWCLMDYTKLPAGFEDKPHEKYFGLITTDYTVKDAYYSIKYYNLEMPELYSNSFDDPDLIDWESNDVGWEVTDGVLINNGNATGEFREIVLEPAGLSDHYQINCDLLIHEGNRAGIILDCLDESNYAFAYMDHKYSVAGIKHMEDGIDTGPFQYETDFFPVLDQWYSVITQSIGNHYYLRIKSEDFYLGLAGVKYLPGKVGLMVFSATAKFDNFTVLSIE